MARSFAGVFRHIWSKSPVARPRGSLAHEFRQEISSISSFPWPCGESHAFLRTRLMAHPPRTGGTPSRQFVGIRSLSTWTNSCTYTAVHHAESSKERRKRIEKASALQILKDRLTLSPYARLMRLEKPIGTHLLFLPGAWAITIGAASIGDAVSLYALFYTGAVLLRGAGCTMNDIWDQDIDSKVQRTRSRPLAAGEISIPKAFVFLGAQLTAGLMVLLSLNNTSIVVGAPAVIPAMFYPLAKRFTNYPQAVLGLTINWAALLGYTAATDTLSVPALCLYGAGWCWTMIYDTIYAHQDKKDDARLGVKSSALSLGSRTRPALIAFCVGKLGFLSAAGIMCGLSAPYYGGIALTGAHLVRQILKTNFDDPNDCWKAFKSNTCTGALTWGALAAGRLL